MPTPAEQLCKLLNYVVEQSKEIDPHGYKLTGHKGFLRQKAGLAGLPGVHFNREVAGDHVWLQVERLEAQHPPAVHPEGLRGLLTVSEEPAGKPPSINEPALAHRLAASGAGKPPEQLQQEASVMRSSVEKALAQYTPLWNAWAAGEKPRRTTIDLYGDLFSLAHQLESEETAKPQELVWGLGVTAWKVSGADGVGVVDFQYPLITQAMEISVEEDLSIVLRPRGVEPRLEFDALSACQLLSVPEVEKAAKQSVEATKERPISPFDAGSYEPVLKLISGNLHEKGRFVRDHEGLPVPGEDLQVTDAWVLLSRPRSNNFLHEDIERLKKRIGDGAKIPEGALALVTPPSDETPDYTPVTFRGLSGTSGGSAGAGGEPKELFFPLPYNHEQVTIVEQLERSEGVAVQGPPGTGKTHTIANIICHFLATGRKVLVTAKGEQALEVLQSKIPEEVRPLTVALLAGDREGMRQFQTSIEAILHNVSQLNPEVVRTEIERVQSAIGQAHGELAEIDRRVDEIALAQLSDVQVDGAPMRAQKMAELVVRGHAQHDWFVDVLDLSEQNAPPLSGAEAAQLREARRILGQDLGYVGVRIPRSLELPSAADIGRLHDTLVSIRDIEEREAAGGLLALRANTPEVLADARKMLSAVEAAAALANELEETGEIWTAELRKKCRQAQFDAERKALEALFSDIQELVKARAEFLQQPVEVPEAALAQPKFAEAVGRGCETGKPFGFLSIGAGEVKAFVAAVRVAGLAPATAEHWQHVKRYLQLHDRVRSFAARWNQFAQTLSIPIVEAGVQALRHIELVTSNARKAHLLATNHDAHLPVLAERVFAQPPLTQVRGTSGDLKQVREHLRSHLTRADLAEAAVLQATLQEKLAGTAGPVSAQLRQLAATLGNRVHNTENVVAQYAGLVAEVRRIEALAHEIGTVAALADRVEKAGAPIWATRLRSETVAAAGEDHAVPVAWRDAWNWARLKTHLSQIEARDELLTMAARRRDLEAGLARLYISMVSKSAWRSTKLAASPKVLSALESYRTAIHKIGKGTGPNATRHRRDAQRAMQNAQGAVPCWVMSHSKVSETLPPIPGSFDLVVVDEASQSDLWALPAILRGAKILVVGDDKQVSPEGGFISSVRVQELKDRFLSDQYHADMLTPEKSLYDIASTVFAAQKVMLREHFRCVPAIIAYSNRFYNGAMQPLRIPRESERIDPPLVDIFVPSGNRNHRDVNVPEAQAILAEIQAILADKRFAGRTIGVVSLLGAEQAKHIDTLVRSNCDGAELIRRHFKCGDARVFQGSERDIMFLSMVVDPRKATALSGNMFEQRFNVAASRARDRMYLVRSVELKDLSQADLRASLIGHFTKPLDGSVDEAKSLVDLCDSGFERDVYTELFKRGYRVTPQVKAGSFFIDMVIEGANDTRLAIELDGDEFHGPDRWQADMNRQRVLERAGWTFWRCFASTWSLHREEVLQELLDRLTAMGIEPLGALEKVPTLVESRVWQPVIKTAEPQSGDLLEDAIAQANSAPAGPTATLKTVAANMRAPGT